MQHIKTFSLFPLYIYALFVNHIMIMEIKRRNIFKTIEPYYETPEAIIITGMRRTGKTTVLKYVYGRINSTNKLFIDLENPLNRQYFEEHKIHPDRFRH